MRAHPIRRTVLTCVATVSVTTLALALKPHSPPATAAPRTPASSRSPAVPGGTGSGGASGKRTLTGETVQTRYGPVQVEITVDGAKITAVRAVKTPSGDRRSQDIASSSVPTLVQETLDAQSARIDTVSGATFTSEGYISSLQSALDQARG
ncbi:FMN-binding protein [Streptomyces sp. NBC_00649]|uniref:FMN-binding protein n=1 Tax=unclassified Streptomyces TaxID=2593676 RepID=UPI003247D801